MRKLDPKKHPKLIAFLEKAQKVLKTVAVSCFSLVIVLCVFFYTKACADKNTAQLISASAEEASTASTSTVAETASDVESGIDSTLYPSANLIQLLDKTETLHGSVIVTTSFDGKVTVKGTATDNGGRWLHFSHPIYLEEGKTYSITQLSRREFIVLDGDSFYYMGQSTFTVSKSGEFYLGFNFISGVEYDLEFYPMLNEGDTLLPFIPNLNAIYNGGYNAGYEAGETDGKESGYNEGLTVAQRGIFDGSTVTCTTYLSGLTNFLSVTPTYINNGVDFSFIFDRWITEQGGSQSVLPNDAVEFKIKFKEGVPFSAFSVYFTHAFNYVDWTTAKVQTDFGTPNYKEYFFTTVQDDLVSKIDKNAVLVQVDVGQDNPQYISSLSFKCAWIPTFYKLQLIALNGGYTQGYNVGYYDGQNNSQLYDNGFDDGYKNGYTVGKSDGFQEGFNQTKSGGFGWLISSVQSFLSAPFFGTFSIGTLLYVMLGCSLVVMVLKFFAGG